MVCLRRESSVVSMKLIASVEVPTAVLRLRLAQNTRQSALRMTNSIMERTFETPHYAKMTVLLA